MRRFPLLFPLLLAAAPVCVQPARAQSSPSDTHRPATHKPNTELDAMLGALKVVPDEAEAGALEARIRQLWLQAGSPAATLLMNRGTRDLGNNAAGDALDDFDAVLALEPNLADAFHRRALARFGLGDYRGAIADIEAALQREPRDFAAFQTLSRIAEAQGDAAGALAAWRKVLELSPKTPGGAERLKLLTRKAEGEAT